MGVISCDTNDSFGQGLTNAQDKLVVVDFSATWCSPCQKVKPQFHALSEDMTDVVFLTVDVDENAEVAEKYGVQAMPTFMLFKNREKLADFTGANITKVKEMINERR
mmetsp:Transcript_24443/g.70503  ORF Transcript_24443/g.70503 Transcript_24443/m.70503 type:complete len:107 (-) Transcript_24443:83-403(-)